MEQTSSDVVIPAGFEPGISALKGRRPDRLVEGTMSALLPELNICYAGMRIVPPSRKIRMSSIVTPNAAARTTRLSTVGSVVPLCHL